MSIFQELKQRNVIRVAVLYAVVSWLILQVADVVFGIAQLPAWSLTLVATLLALGFVPALIFAWIYDVTPEGIKREADIDRNTMGDSAAGRRLNVVTIVLLLLAVAVFVSEPMWRSGGQAETVAGDSPGGTGQPDVVSGERGVAVLPFENLSADADNAFFAGGVHEEVLTHLSHIQDLRVISRTSMLRIAESGLDVREIGKRLAVSHVLEGSVRRAGDRVRVTVQLIDAATDEHLWAENYDRTLDDIFMIQSDIAVEIANRLQATLTPEDIASMSAKLTDNQRAYDLYLRARQEASVWRGRDTFNAMRAQLEEALTLDPDFLKARVLLLTAYGRIFWLSETREDEIFADKAAEQLALIEAQAPTSNDAKLARAVYLYTVERDYERVLDMLTSLQRELPSDIDIAQYIASSLKRLGRSDAFLKAARRLHSLDPESAVVADELFFALSANRMIDEAERIARDSARRYPEYPTSQYTLLEILLLRGNLDAAKALHDRMRQDHPDIFGGNIEFWLAYLTGDADAAEALFAASSETGLDRMYAALTMALIMRVEEDRGSAANGFATKALADLETWLQGNGDKVNARELTDLYAVGALSAAAGGDRAGFDRYRSAFDATRAGIDNFELLSQMAADYTFALGLALLGDPEAGWQLLDPHIENSAHIDFNLTFPRRLNNLAFGSVPGYRAYTERYVAAWAGNGD